MRDLDILRGVAEYIDDHGHAPTYRDLMSVLGYKSMSTTHFRVEKLMEMGLLRQCKKCPEDSARTMFVTPMGREWLRESA